MHKFARHVWKIYCIYGAKRGGWEIPLHHVHNIMYSLSFLDIFSPNVAGGKPARQKVLKIHRKQSFVAHSNSVQGLRVFPPHLVSSKIISFRYTKYTTSGGGIERERTPLRWILPNGNHALPDVYTFVVLNIVRLISP